jgi:hypothetical protein
VTCDRWRCVFAPAILAAQPRGNLLWCCCYGVSGLRQAF